MKLCISCCHPTATHSACN